tara:strand:+ start:1150 stop:1578 length:429 start_codon:yes stop_codon:yes gene_type:complete
MNIVRWNNLSSAMPAMNRLDDLFDSMIYKTLERNQNWTPEVSIFENDKLYTVTMDIPGVEKKDVNIEVEGSCLTVSGKRDEKNEKDMSLYYSQTRYGNFSRTFNLPEEIGVEKISAKYKNGTLILTLPKMEKINNSINIPVK